MTNKNVYNILVLAEGVNSNKLLFIGIDKINTDNEIKIEGRLAQLVERLPYKERVRSSSLLTPTIKIQMTLVIWIFILRLDTRVLRVKDSKRSSADLRTDDTNIIHFSELVRIAKKRSG